MDRSATRPLLLLLSLLFSVPTVVSAQADGRHGPAAADHLFPLVRSSFDGNRALDVVAFVEPFFRLPGNHGYDASLDHVAAILREAGYSLEGDGPDARFTYRFETRPLRGPTWEPVTAELRILGMPGPLLSYASNHNMIAINSPSTPRGGITRPLVYVGRGRPEDYERADISGAIVLGDAPVARLYAEAVVGRGAAGVLSYTMPDYNRAEEHPDVISFSSIRQDPEGRGFALRLSLNARNALLGALQAGPVQVHAEVQTRIYASQERMLVAEIRGTEAPEERFVFSAHVQEPGANDNATGVGCQAEIARVAASLIQEGAIDAPRRTVTFLWGDEIAEVQWYLSEDPERARHVRWGMSLDMVGEDTRKTGGTFLIEKMPDPSAIWPRGEDRHTEWGGRPLDEADMAPHYFNDFVLGRCLQQAEETGWVVRTNPYEGGSDHVPFLRADIPGLLLWHFTDVYYHTDGDRIEMVSAETLKNVGVSALVSALLLASADDAVEDGIRTELLAAGKRRLDTEAVLSREQIARGGDPARERRILQVWTDWYARALETTADISLDGGGDANEAVAQMTAYGKRLMDGLGGTPPWR